MHQYFEGATRQLEGRVRHLIGTIPRDLGRDVDTLVDRCRDRLELVAQGFSDIRENPDLRLPQNQGVRSTGVHSGCSATKMVGHG